MVVKSREVIAPSFGCGREIQARLAVARVETALLFGGTYSCGTNGAEWQAILLVEKQEYLSISSGGHDWREKGGAMKWTPIHLPAAQLSDGPGG